MRRTNLEYDEIVDLYSSASNVLPHCCEVFVDLLYHNLCRFSGENLIKQVPELVSPKQRR